MISGERWNADSLLPIQPDNTTQWSQKFGIPIKKNISQKIADDFYAWDTLFKFSMCTERSGIQSHRDESLQNVMCDVSCIITSHFPRTSSWFFQAKTERNEQTCTVSHNLKKRVL